MTGLRVAYALAVLTACWVPVAAGAEPSVAVLGALVLALVIDSALDACRRRGWRALGLLALWNALVVAAAGLALHQSGAESGAFWAEVVAVWLGAWLLVALVADLPRRKGVLGLIAPLLFGATILWGWETVVRALNVPRVILPALFPAILTG
ncbi:MAG TPA: hypothetical protein PLG62_13655, partial [Pararhodobacter sp.]|nr:hypothetical protein [Pararhodobacter sp.]